MISIYDYPLQLSFIKIPDMMMLNRPPAGSICAGMPHVFENAFAGIRIQFAQCVKTVFQPSVTAPVEERAGPGVTDQHRSVDGDDARVLADVRRRAGRVEHVRQVFRVGEQAAVLGPGEIHPPTALPVRYTHSR